MERHLTKVIAGTYFLRLHYKFAGTLGQLRLTLNKSSLRMGVGFPAAWVAEGEPGSFVFGLSGCHVVLGARAVLRDRSRLADPPVFMAHGGPAFERNAYLTLFCLPKNSVKRDT